MRSKARRLKVEHGVGMLMIDYLQLMQTGKRSENRVQEISEISRFLKSLARELDVPVLALSQLSRGRGAEGWRPQAYPFRPAGERQSRTGLGILSCLSIAMNTTIKNPKTKDC